MVVFVANTESHDLVEGLNICAHMHMNILPGVDKTMVIFVFTILALRSGYIGLVTWF